MIGYIDGDVLLNASIWKTTDLDSAISKTLYTIEDWADKAFCDEVYIALGPFDSWHYRNNIHPSYKQTASRIDGREKRLAHFKKLKEFIASLEYTSVANGLEADDLLGHWQTQQTGVIITVDKDLDQVPGLHFGPRKNQEQGALYNVTEQEADKFFLRQMITGDGMDKIPGLPGKGPKFADTVLEEYTLEEGKLANKIIDLYKEKYEDDWENHFLLNGKLLWIQRKPEQYFTLELYREKFY